MQLEGDREEPCVFIVILIITIIIIIILNLKKNENKTTELKNQLCNCRGIGRSLASSREELGETSDSGRKMMILLLLLLMMMMMVMMVMTVMMVMMTVTQAGWRVFEEEKNMKPKGFSEGFRGV